MFDTIEQAREALRATEDTTKRREILADVLDSDLYQYGRAYLRKDGCFCVMGVACDLFDPSGWYLKEPDRDIWSYLDDVAWPKEAVRLFFGVTEPVTLNAMNRNDEGGSYDAAIPIILNSFSTDDDS